MFRVLIIEDEDIIRKGLIFTTNWKQANCIVVGEAANGLEGVKEIERLKPDIVITDINMPHKDGLNMLRETMHVYHYDAIIISGYNEFEYAKQAISLGVSEYLLKPIVSEELYKALEKITSKREADLELKSQMESMDFENLNNSILPHEKIAATSDMNKYTYIMISYIQERYFKKISINDISKKYDISSTYLNSKFKSDTGYTFGDYLNRYRIKKSIELLNKNEYKVYEVADMIGMYDYKYFIKVFKKYVGDTPLKFIQRTKDHIT